MVDTMRTRRVAAAANAGDVNMPWLGYATRAPTATHEYGPSSIRRHHSRIVGPSHPTTNEGNVMPSFMRLLNSSGFDDPSRSEAEASRAAASPGRHRRTEPRLRVTEAVATSGGAEITRSWGRP